MNVTIELNEEQIVNLLEYYGYTTEEVKGYYSTDIHHLPYDSPDYNVDKDILNYINLVIAYKKGERPSELENEYPLLFNLMPFYYDRVINSLFSKRITEQLNL